MSVKNNLAVLVFISSVIALGQFVSADLQAELPPVTITTAQYNIPYSIFLDCTQANGTVCTSSALCNITRLQSPNQTIIVNNKIMGGQFYPSWNYSLGALKDFGWYDGLQTCCDQGACGNRRFNFELTADGKSSQSLPYQFLILLIFTALAIIGTYFDGVDVLKYIGGVGMMVMGVLTLYPGYSYVNWNNLLGQVIGIIAIGFGFLATIYNYVRGEPIQGGDDD